MKKRELTRTRRWERREAAKVASDAAKADSDAAPRECDGLVLSVNAQCAKVPGPHMHPTGIPIQESQPLGW